MYYPYFRGKQFELISIRETVQLLADKGFVPIIEPVREPLRGLERTLRAIQDAGGKAIVIVNPDHGDHQADGASITKLLQDEFLGCQDICAGILLRSQMSLADVVSCYSSHADHHPVLVHAGYTAPRDLALAFSDRMAEMRNVFFDNYSALLYRRHFEASRRILLKDGFNRRRNADYPAVEAFSELHVTYDSELNMQGFGDFLVVGDTFSEGGGPAYAVAIHLTYIDHEHDDVMYVYHFVSDERDTPTNPAGKFGQALAKLVTALDTGNSKLLESSAIREFRDLHEKGHFPGLGYVKKLSMKHHLETLADHLG